MAEVSPVPARLEAIGMASTMLYPGREVAMPAAYVHGNLSATMARLVAGAYAPRTGRPREIRLVELPPDATVFGHSLFLLKCGGVLAEEQIQPAWLQNGVPPSAWQATEPHASIDGEVMLIARYGERTWGHWLCELLPKVAICEHHFPGRFRYAVQRDCLGSDIVSVRLAESLLAYGVSADRLIPVSEGTFRFARLFAVTPVWTDSMMHPDVLALMQSGVRVATPGPRIPDGRAALLRGDNARRQLANLPQITTLLQARGFTVTDVAKLSFDDQVAVFRNSKTVFSILGSSLSGLIYSPEHVDVISAAPDEFADRFFYALMQAKNARYADLRGPVAGEPLALYRDSPFTLKPDILSGALDVLEGKRLPDAEIVQGPRPDAGCPAPDTVTAPRMAHEPLTPILISAATQDAGTALARLLGRSPEIVVAQRTPSTVRLIAYYATMFGALNTPADERVHQQGRGKSGFALGSNPFSHADYATAFETGAVHQDFFGKFVPSHMAHCARDLTLEYYKRLARDNGKPDVRYFAEPGQKLHRPTRMFARRAFGAVREVLIVRDPRDLLCARLARSTRGPDEAFQEVSALVRQMSALHREQRSDVCIIRHEDFAIGDEACFAALSTFLAAPIMPPESAGSAEKPPAAWRDGLPAPIKARCAAAWAEFLNIFGYGN